MKKAYSGNMTAHSRKRVMRAVDMMLQRNPKRRIQNPITGNEHDFQVGFVTLTIPDPKPVDASWSHKELLEPFLRTARRKWGVEDYIWKAELQQRGQLHYHITWTQFVDFTQIRNAWNNLLHKHRLSDDYAKRFRTFHPNSTDVHAVWRIKNLKAYLAKYIAKETQNQKSIKAKVWDCSKSLKKAMYATELTTAHEVLLNDAVNQGIAHVIKLDNCTIIKVPNPVNVLANHEKADYKSHIT